MNDERRTVNTMLYWLTIFAHSNHFLPLRSTHTPVGHSFIRLYAIRVAQTRCELNLESLISSAAMLRHRLLYLAAQELEVFMTKKGANTYAGDEPRIH
jgi:hypothetical protein